MGLCQYYLVLEDVSQLGFMHFWELFQHKLLVTFVIIAALVRRYLIVAHIQYFFSYFIISWGEHFLVRLPESVSL
jgi:hypothetical protein